MYHSLYFFVFIVVSQSHGNDCLFSISFLNLVENFLHLAFTSLESDLISLSTSSVVIVSSII
mgnify:FL=1